MQPAHAIEQVEQAAVVDGDVVALHALRTRRYVGHEVGDLLHRVRVGDVDDAQVLLVNLAKDLAAKGELVISKQRGDEELVY